MKNRTNDDDESKKHSKFLPDSIQVSDKFIHWKSAAQNFRRFPLKLKGDERKLFKQELFCDAADWRIYP